MDSFQHGVYSCRVGYVERNINKVSQRIENVNYSIKTMDASINNASAISKDFKKIRLECKIIKCFEKIKCEIVTNKEVFQ